MRPAKSLEYKCINVNAVRQDLLADSVLAFFFLFSWFSFFFLVSRSFAASVACLFVCTDRSDVDSGRCNIRCLLAAAARSPAGVQSQRRDYQATVHSTRLSGHLLAGHV
jgi:hypothetical protein